MWPQHKPEFHLLCQYLQFVLLIKTKRRHFVARAEVFGTNPVTSLVSSSKHHTVEGEALWDRILSVCQGWVGGGSGTGWWQEKYCPVMYLSHRNLSHWPMEQDQSFSTTGQWWSCSRSSCWEVEQSLRLFKPSNSSLITVPEIPKLISACRVWAAISQAEVAAQKHRLLVQSPEPQVF